MIHDPFAGLSGDTLAESKAIGSADLKANVGERDLSMRYLPRGQVRQAIQAASSNAGRALNRIYQRHRQGMQDVIEGMTSGQITRNEARIRSARLFRESYEAVREVARRASALGRLAHEATIYREEEKWFRSAVREEIRYFHAFLDDIARDRTSRIQERIEDYTKALRFMYESARIQAMPDNVLLYWRGPRASEDPKVCEGCEYLMERSPYPKDLIPAVPRDGTTPCLVNCRHHILVRVAENLNDITRRRSALGKRKSMLRHLKEIKEDAGLGRRLPRTSRKARNPFEGAPMTRRTATRLKGRGLR